jgi:hypothetical protein
MIGICILHRAQGGPLCTWTLVFNLIFGTILLFVQCVLDQARDITRLGALGPDL